MRRCYYLNNKHSKTVGLTKHEVAQICLQEGHGILGDAHAGNWHRQVSLLGMESVAKVKAVLPDLAPGAFAENILTSGLTLYSLPVGTKIRVGEAILEITQIGKECHQGCAIRRLTGDCVMPREGVFAVVLKGGTVRKGDEIALVPA